nr:hypothetical protein HK105_007100 [Polyrhizophydium stewartii]
MLSEKQAARTQLAPSTPEFAQLEYGLQLTLRASTVRIVAAYAISNPHISAQFERRAKDVLTLPAWIDAAAFGGINTEDDVVRRGFRFPPPHQGLRFTVGRIDGGADKDALAAAGKTLCKAMLCQVAVGRAYVADQAAAEREPVPDGYDSFYIQDPAALADAPVVGSGTYEHAYYIKNPAQVLPQYIVHYEYDPMREKQSREKARCDNCEDELATVHCAADAANLCNKCDAALHQSKLASRHVRTPMGKGSDVFGNCRHHPDKAIEFFCSLCHVPVCVFCKMVGNHANGEAARHQLVSVTEAYQSVLQEAQTPDPILQSRRTEISNQISAVNSRARAVEKMGSQIEQQIEEMYQRAMRELKAIIQDKLTVLLGDELELRRQMSEIDRLEDFLRYQQLGDATTYLFSWSRHQHFRAALHDFGFFRSEIDVQLDARVAGTLSVVVDEDKHGGSGGGGGSGSAGSAGSMNKNGGIGMGGMGGGGMIVGSSLGASAVASMGSGGLALSPGVESALAKGSFLSKPSSIGGLGEFFAEALGGFDQLGIGHGAGMDDDIEHLTGGYRHD